MTDIVYSEVREWYIHIFDTGEDVLVGVLIEKLLV